VPANHYAWNATDSDSDCSSGWAELNWTGMGWDGMGWVSGISDLCLGDAFVCCLEVAGILWAGGRTAGRQGDGQQRWAWAPEKCKWCSCRKSSSPEEAKEGLEFGRIGCLRFCVDVFFNEPLIDICIYFARVGQPSITGTGSPGAAREWEKRIF